MIVIFFKKVITLVVSFKLKIRKSKNISYARHKINKSDIRAVSKALKSDWLTIGPLVEELESKIKNKTNSEAVVVSSGTAALHCAYYAIGCTEGDEIITPAITFAATQATAKIFGATIKYADIDYDSGNINIESAANLINKKTKAIVTVDYAGQPTNLNKLKELAVKNNIYLIEDAAHSFGSSYEGKPVGSIADLTTFSFFATKNITTGEGGAITSNNRELLEKARKFARQGHERDKDNLQIVTEGLWHQEVQSQGLNYRLPDILCALGISQLKNIDKFKEIRRKIFRTYYESLSSIAQLDLPFSDPNTDPFWHLFAVKVPSEKRLEFFNYMRKNGVLVQVNYLPVYRHPFFEDSSSEANCPNAEYFYSREVSLPIHANLTTSQLKKILNLIHKFKFD